ncbi:hypothetical protein KIN20_011601 [Parelaphostrongylus tenuis]|uniref:Uncharacterized protein n=1 Tax=Parelaphostrongylus tenuis TaxID=148309 RepID=A0AAD5QMK7_PARTN|nr:hypothetical protein KIN20_011601 [Parelaphostrongylus tenuis]
MLATIKEYIKEKLQLQNQVREKVNLKDDLRDTNVGSPPQTYSKQQKMITRKPCFYCERQGTDQTIATTFES